MNPLHALAQPGVTVVLGLPGAGKSHLLSRAAAQLGAAPVTLIDGAESLTAEALSRLAKGEGHAWVTSRTTVSLEVRVVRLEGLTEEEAALAWAHWDTLRAPATTFSRAWSLTFGHPQWLKALHDGEPLGDDGLSTTVARLSPGALLVLAACAVGTRLRLSHLVPLTARDAAEEVRALSDALLLRVDAEGQHEVPRVVKTAVLRRLEHPDARATRTRLLEALETVPVDLADRLFLRLEGHLALAQHDAATALLGRDWRLALEAGRAEALVDVLERWPASWRTSDAWLTARLSCHLRLLTLHEATGLRAAWKEPTAGCFRFGLSLALLALMRGELKDALTLCSALETLAHEDQPLVSLVRAQVEAMIDGPRAAREKLEAVRDEGDLRLFVGARFLEWQERHIEPSRLGARSPNFGRNATDGYRSQALLLMLFGSFGAGAPPRDTGAAMTVAEHALTRGNDPLSRLHLQILVAIEKWEGGQRRAALAQLDAIAAHAESVDYFMLSLWLRLWSARLSLALGHELDGRVALERVGVRAVAMGASWLGQVANAAQRDALTRRLLEAFAAPLVATDAAMSFRTRAFLALRAAVVGDAALVSRALDGWADRRGTPDFPLETLLAQLADWVLQGLSVPGLRVSHAEALEQSFALATQLGADRDSARRLIDVVGDEVWIGASERRLGVGFEAPGGLIIDAVTHQVRTGKKVLSLARAQSVRRLLYALARSNGRPLAKEALVEATWKVAYNPRLHDNTLFVSLNRLRETLAGASLRVETDAGGYLLRHRGELWYRGPLWRRD